jgi:hypothetical protein
MLPSWNQYDEPVKSCVRSILCSDVGDASEQRGLRRSNMRIIRGKTESSGQATDHRSPPIF